MTMRDHSQPCDHTDAGGWYWKGTIDDKLYQCSVESCPGGRDITIDYEAAARWTHAEMVRRGPTDLTWESAYPEEQADHLFLALGAVGAALDDNKTVEELREAAFDMVET